MPRRYPKSRRRSIPQVCRSQQRVMCTAAYGDRHCRVFPLIEGSLTGGYGLRLSKAQIESVKRRLRVDSMDGVSIKTPILALLEMMCTTCEVILDK